MGKTIEITIAQAALAAELAQSEHAKTMLATGVKKEARIKAAQEYAKLAKSLGVPQESWGVDDASNAGRSSGAIYYGACAALAALGERGSGALGELVKEGGSLWCRYVTVTKSWGAKCNVNLGDEYDYTPETLIRNYSDSRAASLFKAALPAPERNLQVYLTAVLQDYGVGVQGSSKTAKGVLGAADKRAKRVAGLVVACETEALAAAARVEGELKEKIEAMVKDAKERLEAKSQTSALESDPEAIKRVVSKEQKARLGALGEAIARCPEDEDFLGMMFDGCAWLKEQPILGCIKFTSGETLAGIALGSGSTEALRRLDAMGANLWLAAAQEGSANACEWAVHKMYPSRGRRGGGDAGLIARALMKGAWLNGASDPKAECLAMCAEVFNKQGRWFDEVAKKLSSALEREALADAIGTAQILGAKAAAPAKRASAL